MEQFEVILVDFPKQYIDSFVAQELVLVGENMRSSHFYDQAAEQDLQFAQVNSVANTLSPTGTGNVVLHQLDFGVIIRDVMVVFSFVQEICDVTLKFQVN